jgi:hypothetical protein
MKLPNPENAVVDFEKLTDYCLSPDHPRGKHKARVFEAVCGLKAEHAESFRQQLLEAAQFNEAVETGSDFHGRRFNLECMILGPLAAAVVQTAWIVRPGEDFARFVTAYVK